MDKLLRFNRHFESDFFYEVGHPRECYPELESRFELPLMLGLFGLRRVGKTTTLRHLINYLITSRKIDRSKILYFSFDDPKYGVWDVIRLYEQYIGTKIDSSFYFFFDEVQKVPEWEVAIKELYDTYKCQVCISGSESAVIQKSTDSLAGRIYEHQLEPLTFTEYLQFTNQSHLLGKNIDLTNQYESYLYRQFPETVSFTITQTTEYIKSIIRKILNEDIPKFFVVRDTELLMRLFMMIVHKPGILIDFNAISQELGVSRNTISSYFGILEQSFLIKKVYNYSQNMLTSEKKLKKYYTYPALHYTCTEISLLVESHMLMQSQIQFFWRNPRKEEVDFICAQPFIAGEVKYKNHIHKSDLQTLETFSQKIGAKPVLITKYASIIHATHGLVQLYPWQIRDYLFT